MKRSESDPYQPLAVRDSCQGRIRILENAKGALTGCLLFNYFLSSLF